MLSLLWHSVKQRSSAVCCWLSVLALASLLSAGQAQAAGVTTVSAASFALAPVAPESIVSTFGSNLATGPFVSSQLPLPTDLGGTKVRVVDAQGTEGFAQLFFASTSQINWYIPAWVSPGIARVDVLTPGGGVASGTVTIAPVAPALFTADATGSGPPAANALRVRADQSRTSPLIFQCVLAKCHPAPIYLGSADEVVVISLFGTGIRGHSTITAHVNDEQVEVLGAQAQGEFVGLDQVNVRIPFGMRNRGLVSLTVTADGVSSNPVALLLTDYNASSVEPVKIAFIADSDSLVFWDEVLDLIQREGADLVLEQGGFFGGGATFAQWRDPIAAELDPSRAGGLMPVLGPPVANNFPPEQEQYFLDVANHMEQNLGAAWGGCISRARPPKGEVSFDSCDGSTTGGTPRAGDYWLRWKGVSMAFQNGSARLGFVPEVFENNQSVWKLCLWHANHYDFQAFGEGIVSNGKDTSYSYELYRQCAAFGALVFNGHARQYSRSCVLTDIGNFNNGGPAVPNRVNREPGTQLQGHGQICTYAGNPSASSLVDQATIGPGRTIAIVSSLGGHDLWRQYYAQPRFGAEIPQDAYRHDNDGWWATIFANGRYCRNNCTKADLSGQDRSVDLRRLRGGDNLESPGALFITFNMDKNGNINPFKAHGYFKTATFPGVIEGRIIDQFELTFDPDAGVFLVPTRQPEPPKDPNPTPDPGPDPPALACLDRSGPVVTASGLNPTYGNANRFLIFDIADNTIVDATQAEWRGTRGFPVDFVGVDGGQGGVCLSGGKITGEFVPAQMTHDAYHSTSALGVRGADFLLENTYAENYGDGIRFANKEDQNTCELKHASSNFVVREVYFKDMHDDCIEDDWGNSGLILDSLFEGCFTGFSTRPGGDCARKLDATNNVVTIRNSLVWMKPTTFADFPLGNGELFKDDDNGPQWALHNNIIRADQGVLFDELDKVGYGMRRINKQPGDPESKLLSCSNNVFVWTGPGDFPPPYDNNADRIPLQFLKDPTSGKPCFTFTKDVSVWDDAVATWKASHGY